MSRFSMIVRRILVGLALVAVAATPAMAHAAQQGTDPYQQGRIDQQRDDCRKAGVTVQDGLDKGIIDDDEDLHIANRFVIVICPQVFRR